MFGPFKTYYNGNADDFMVNNSGKLITTYDIRTLVGKAYPSAYNPVNIAKGFLQLAFMLLMHLYLAISITLVHKFQIDQMLQQVYFLRLLL